VMGTYSVKNAEEHKSAWERPNEYASTDGIPIEVKERRKKEKEKKRREEEEAKKGAYNTNTHSELR